MEFGWENDNFDIKRYDLNNYFKTHEQAEQARDEIKKLLLNLHEND